VSMEDTPSRHELSERQIAHLTESGRLSADEADQLQIGDEATRQAVMGGIKSRHVLERLSGAIAAGLISEPEATVIAGQVRSGDHDAELRKRINDLARLASDGGDAS
jgi:hypothetical protein